MYVSHEYRHISCFTMRALSVWTFVRILCNHCSMSMVYGVDKTSLVCCTHFSWNRKLPGVWIDWERMILRIVAAYKSCLIELKKPEVVSTSHCKQEHPRGNIVEEQGLHQHSLHSLPTLLKDPIIIAYVYDKTILNRTYLYCHHDIHLQLTQARVHSQWFND